MNTWRRVPQRERLRHFIECYWYLEVADQPEQATPLLPPSALAHYILAPTAQCFCYAVGRQTFQGRGSHLLFANRQTLRLDETYPLKRLGIAFKPGTLYAWLGLSGDAGGTIGTSNLSRFGDLNRIDAFGRLGGSATPETTVRYLDEALSALFETVRQDRAFRLARRAMADMDARHDHNRHQMAPFDTHEQLADRIGCSKRTLERAMARVTGITLSQYRTMLKFNSLLVYIHRQANQDIDWTSLAQSFGFSDQSHLIRQLKQLIGSTPGEYLQRRNILIDVYGDFGSS